jgi:phosphopantothenoylcysteine decarboxylase/phosphopantothenate--cysteine ligase
MYEAVHNEYDRADIVIMAAAVADFGVENPSPHKIKREQQPTLTLTLKKNPDILKSLGERKQHQVLVGFALETSDGLTGARAKLAAKHLDLIVLNNPLEPGAGFGSDTNRVRIVSADGNVEELPLMSKFDAALKILDRAAALRHH